MDSKRTRRTIIAPLGGIALAMALIVAIPAAASAAGPATAWTRQFGTSEDEIAHMVAVDSRGRILVAGWKEGTLPSQTSKGGSDAFVRAYRH